MAFCWKNFDRSKIVVAPPAKAPGEHDYATWKITYGGQKLQFFSPETLTCTRISEDKLKPGQLSQGFHLAVPETLKMLLEIEDEILKQILKHRDNDATPGYLKDCETVEDILKLSKFIKVKTVVYRPKKKNAQGKPTKDVDMTVTPLLYANMMQYGAKHPERPNEVLTKYTDIRLLDLQNKNKERVAQGQQALAINEAQYSFAATDLFKAKTAMKGKPICEITDVFGSATTFKTRQSLSEVFIVNFEAAESAARKEIRDVLIQTGEKIEGPKLTLPSPPVAGAGDDDEHHSDEGESHSNPLPIPKGTDEFKVQILS